MKSLDPSPKDITACRAYSLSFWPLWFILSYPSSTFGPSFLVSNLFALLSVIYLGHPYYLILSFVSTMPTHLSLLPQLEATRMCTGWRSCRPTPLNLLPLVSSLPEAQGGCGIVAAAQREMPSSTAEGFRHLPMRATRNSTSTKSDVATGPTLIPRHPRFPRPGLGDGGREHLAVGRRGSPVGHMTLSVQQLVILVRLAPPLGSDPIRPRQQREHEFAELESCTAMTQDELGKSSRHGKTSSLNSRGNCTTRHNKASPGKKKDKTSSGKVKGRRAR